MTETGQDELEKKAPEVVDANASPLIADRGEAIVAEPKTRPDFSGVEGVYLDLDDTICGYWDASKAGLRKAFAEEGPEGFTPEEMVRHWAAAYREFAPLIKTPEWYPEYLRSGQRTRTEQMRRMLHRMGIFDEARAEALSEAYMRYRDSHLRLFPEALESLDRLATRFPLGLMTNGPADIQRQEIATLGIGPRFAHFFIEGEVGMGKPHAEVYRRAAEAMGLPPEKMVMIGNSFRHDIEGAMKAGWKAIWIRRPSDVPPSADGSAGVPEELPHGAVHPDGIVQSLSEVCDLLDV